MPALIVSTWSFGKRGNDAAWPILARGGPSIDAVEKACETVDADPQVDSVGFGGLPDSSGHVSLDGCIMTAPNRCGSVCAIRRFMHPVSIARKVMEHTSHIMLAGDGADAFAQQQGFLPADLLSADAQDAYHQWLKDRKTVDQSRDENYLAPRPVDYGIAGGGKLFFHPAPGDDRDDGKPDPEARWKHHDTIGVLAIDSRGVLAGACSTSGTPYKTPGRVGDSPIIGHGLYVHPDDGAAVATGSGELVMGVCGTFLAVEEMRRGASPVDAACAALQRIIDSFELRPEHQVAIITLSKHGQFASAALRDGYKTSIHDKSRSEIIDPDCILLS